MVDFSDVRGKWDLGELPSLTGKVAIVTGANSPNGIGYNIAHQLFLKGAKVYVGARSIEKATGAIKTMAASAPTLDSGLLKPFVADLADLKSVQHAAKQVSTQEDRLDIIVNNAAYTTLTNLSEDQTVDANGISPPIAVTHFGGFVLTTTLLPLLTKTAKLPDADVRVVTVSSVALWDAPATSKFDSLDALNNSYKTDATGPVFSFISATFDESVRDNHRSNYNCYGYGKLTNVLFASELQRRLDAQGVPILSLSVHPGGVATNGALGFLGSDNVSNPPMSLQPSFYTVPCYLHRDMDFPVKDFTGSYRRVAYNLAISLGLQS